MKIEVGKTYITGNGYIYQIFTREEAKKKYRHIGSPYHEYVGIGKGDYDDAHPSWMPYNLDGTTKISSRQGWELIKEVGEEALSPKRQIAPKTTYTKQNTSYPWGGWQKSKN